MHVYRHGGCGGRPARGPVFSEALRRKLPVGKGRRGPGHHAEQSG